MLLTPRDILTQDDTWINKEDFFREFDDIPVAIGNQELRAQVDNYFRSVLPDNPDQKERRTAISKTALEFPELFDYFIKHKEDTGDLAKQRSTEKVEASRALYIQRGERSDSCVVGAHGFLYGTHRNANRRAAPN